MRYTGYSMAMALSARLILNRHLLDKPIGDIGEVIRSKKPRKLPVVLTHDEAMAITNQMGETDCLIASLLYGSGLRITEACRLRIKDLDFQQQVVTVRDGKGAKDRTTLLPAPLLAPLQCHINTIRKAWREQDKAFLHPVSLPFALARKYPNAGRSLEWQWLFRHHLLAPITLATWFVTIGILPLFKRPYAMPSNKLALASGRVVIRAGTRLQPSY